MKIILGATLLALIAACTTAGGGSASGFTSQRTTMAARPAEDRARDAGRKPFQVMSFLGVQPGMKVLDVLAAGGYYTEVFANAVGPDGVVFAQNTPRMLRFFGGRNDRAMNARLMSGRLPNVRRLDRDFADLGLVDNSIDVALTALNFHDVYNANPEAAQGMLLIIKRVLKPGGVLGIIDHVGNLGADNAKLHRIDPTLVIAAARKAGFTVEQSDLLANPLDDHTQGPFAEGLRGQTDRFLLRLTKPAGA